MSTNNQWTEGRYVGRARPQIAAKTTDTGLRLAVTLDILNEGYEGRILTWFGNIGVSEAADDFAIRSLRDMGWTATAFDDPSGLGSAEVDIVVKYREYKGEKKLDVTVWKPRGEAFAFDAPADSNSVAAATARLKGKLVASLGKSGAPKPAAAPAFTLPGAPPAPSAGGDDIPF
jgi:hypothetical protein